MNIKNTFLTTIFILHAIAASAQAVNRYVPAQYPTIQAAIDACNDDDIVIIDPNTYTGTGNYDIDFNCKSITVRSTDPNNPNVVAATIIDPNWAGPAFQFLSGGSR